MARSDTAQKKASRRANPDGQPVRSFRALLDHLATLTRNDLKYGTSENSPIIATLAEPTADQKRAFELLDTNIPFAPK